MPSKQSKDAKNHTTNGLGQKRTREETQDSEQREAAIDAVLRILSPHQREYGAFKKLIMKARDVNVVNKRKVTLLHRAATVEDFPNRLRLLKALIAAGADLEVTGKRENTALLGAARGGEVAMVEALIAAGANLNASDDFGDTPLHSTAELGHVGAAKALIAAGASLHEVDNHGKTPLHVAVMMENTELMKILIAGGSDLNSTERCGETLLCTAVQGEKMDVIRALIDSGADVNYPNKLDPSPLLSSERIMVIGDLSLQTPLMVACRYNLPKIAEALIAAGADVNQIGGQRRDITSLSLASQRGHAEVVALLKASGAVSFDQTDKSGSGKE